jgi:hypothetical protein
LVKRVENAKEKVVVLVAEKPLVMGFSVELADAGQPRKKVCRAMQ